jgi:AraC-like DNA-binding protein
MIHFSYTVTSFKKFIDAFAEVLGSRADNDRLVCPPAMGEGYARFLQMPNGLELLLLDFCLSQDVFFKRLPAGGDYFIFTCEEVTVPETLEYKTAGEPHLEQQTRRSAMFLVNNDTEYEVHARPGVRVRSIRVLMRSDWLAAYFSIDHQSEAVMRYLMFKIKSMLLKEPDFESRELLYELLRYGAGDEKGLMYYESRLMLILENFFQWMQAQQPVHDFDAKISRGDVERIVEVEKVLLKDLSHAPFIDELSKIAGMSSAKFKKLFKEVYGLPVYQYFQKKRMQQAQRLLQKPGASVSDVALDLGYENMSNFSLAYKKQFGILPSESIPKS